MGSGSKPVILIDGCVSKRVLSLIFVAESLLRTAQDWSIPG